MRTSNQKRLLSNTKNIAPDRALELQSVQGLSQRWKEKIKGCCGKKGAKEVFRGAKEKKKIFPFSFGEEFLL